MPSLGNLSVTLGADTRQLDKSVDSAKDKLVGLSNTMRNVVDGSVKLGLAAGAAGAAIIAGLVNSGRLAIDAQAKLAQSMDATIGGLRAVEMAAGDAGVATEELYSEASKLNGRLGDATRLTGPAADALKKLGLNAQTLLGMDIDQRFATIADAMRKMNLAGGQAQDIMRDLGVRNENLANLMRQGGDAFREQADEVRRLGLNLSMVDAAQVEAANRAIDDMGDVITVIKDKLAVASAPYLEVLATKFKELAIGSNGFKDIIDDVIKGIIKGFGKAADFIQGLRVAFKIAEVSAQGFWALMLTSADLVATGLAAVGDVIATVTNVMIASYNKIYGAQKQLMDMPSKSEFLIGLSDSAEKAREGVIQVNAELAALASQEMPSSGVDKYLDDVANKSKAAAAEVVAARQSMLGGGSVGSMEDTSQADTQKQDQYKKDMEAWNQKNTSELDALKNRYMTEEQLLAIHHEEMLIIGETYDQTKFDSEEQWRSVREQAEADHLARMTDLNKNAYEGIANIINMKWGKGASITANAMKSIVGTMATGSRKAFEVSKAWATADALISTFQGIAKGVALGYPAAIPAVALAAATGFAQVTAIRNQSFGGGGGAAASGNGAAGTAPNPVGVGGSTGSGGANSNQTLTLAPIDPNAIFGGAQVEAMSKRLVNFQKDGGTVVFSA